RTVEQVVIEVEDRRIGEVEVLVHTEFSVRQTGTYREGRVVINAAGTVEAVADTVVTAAIRRTAALAGAGVAGGGPGVRHHASGAVEEQRGLGVVAFSHPRGKR